MTISWKHAVRYSDKMLQRCIGLQAGNNNKLQTCSEMLQRCIGFLASFYNKLQTCSEIQYQDVAEIHLLTGR